MAKKDWIYTLLNAHFGDLSDLAITGRTFPFRMRADIQRAIDQMLTANEQVALFCSVHQEYAHEGYAFQGLLVADRRSPIVQVAPRYEEMDIGEAQPLRCLVNGLWLLANGDERHAVLLTPAMQHGCASGLEIQLATRGGEDGVRWTQRIFKALEEAVSQSACYRSKILSLEQPPRFGGESGGLTVHELRPVARDEVILPATTVALLERNVIGFLRQRPRLRELGLPTKKGLLFYGPPGTGKTHTIHYLASALEEHTTFLVSAEQVGLIDEYMALARLLQPSVVVIEDVDLIARDRARMRNPVEEVMLNKLLNQMDGLQRDADVLFILTTNRPESLEAALASRPGRIDQAIEFPLPDDASRGKLLDLYACGMQLDDAFKASAVKRTENVSAAFIKELMRRTAQFLLERGGADAPSVGDLDQALDELLFSGGSLNRTLLGAHADGPEA